jgi:uncharacterized protein
MMLLYRCSPNIYVMKVTKLLLTIAGFMILTGCLKTKTEELPIQEPDITKKEDERIRGLEEEKIPEPEVLEKEIHALPEELSLEYFANMRLEGTGLTLYLASSNETYSRYRISYLSNGLTISGIMNIPHGKGPFPLVVLNHGFISPSVYTNGRGLKREQDYFARNGFAVIHSDYRGHAESDPSPDESMVYDATIEYSMDVVNAIYAVQNADLPEVDASRVGMLGHSLGGGIALNIAVSYPDMISALILYAPVHSDAWENFSRWRDMRGEGDRTREALGTREENPENWDKLSSLTYLENITAPVLLFQGTEDEDVPKEWSDFLAKKLEGLDKDITYIEYEGEKHEFIPKWNGFMETSSSFLNDKGLISQ